MGRLLVCHLTGKTHHLKFPFWSLQGVEVIIGVCGVVHLHLSRPAGVCALVSSAEFGDMRWSDKPPWFG